jgi:hypothetical protein
MRSHIEILNNLGFPKRPGFTLWDILGTKFNAEIRGAAERDTTVLIGTVIGFQIAGQVVFMLTSVGVFSIGQFEDIPHRVLSTVIQDGLTNRVVSFQWI